MLPELGSIGPFTFYSFGLMAALAIVLAALFMATDLRQRGLDPSFSIEIAFAAGIGGFIGGRVYYVVEHWGEPGESLISGAGLAWYGGVAGGVIAVVLLAAWRRASLGIVANIVAATAAAATAPTRATDPPTIAEVAMVADPADTPLAVAPALDAVAAAPPAAGAPESAANAAAPAPNTIGSSTSARCRDRSLASAARARHASHSAR